MTRQRCQDPIVSRKSQLDLSRGFVFVNSGKTVVIKRKVRTFFLEDEASDGVGLFDGKKAAVGKSYCRQRCSSASKRYHEKQTKARLSVILNIVAAGDWATRSEQ